MSNFNKIGLYSLDCEYFNSHHSYRFGYKGQACPPFWWKKNNDVVGAENINTAMFWEFYISIIAFCGFANYVFEAIQNLNQNFHLAFLNFCRLKNTPVGDNTNRGNVFINNILYVANS